MFASALVLATCLSAAPSAHLLPELAAAAEPAARSAKLLDEVLAVAPRGWPTGAIVGAAVGYGSTAVFTGVGLLFIYVLESGVGVAAIVGLGFIGLAAIGLIVGVISTVVGLVEANHRAHHVSELQEERRRLEAAPQSVAPSPSLMLARF